jgi:hypothetical protein
LTWFCGLSRIPRICGTEAVRSNSGASPFELRLVAAAHGSSAVSRSHIRVALAHRPLEPRESSGVYFHRERCFRRAGQVRCTRS